MERTRFNLKLTVDGEEVEIKDAELGSNQVSGIVSALNNGGETFVKYTKAGVVYGINKSKVSKYELSSETYDDGNVVGGC